MGCPPGQHQHMGSRGKMLRCHPVSDEHESEKTRTFHQMALSQSGRGSIGRKKDDVDLETEDKSLISPEKKERIKANNKKIRQALNQLTRGKFKSLFVPLTAILWTYDGMSNKIADYKKNAKTKNDKKMADAYEKTVEEIVNEMPDIDVDTWGENTVNELTEKYRQKVDKLKQAVKNKGTKDCVEYAQYRAYRDYLMLADEKQAKIVQRVTRERAKTQQTLRGTRSANNRNPKLKDGGVPSKEEILDKCGFAKKVLSPESDKTKNKTDNLKEWDAIQQRNAEREKKKEEAEHKKIEELGSRTRTSPMGKIHRKPIIK